MSRESYVARFVKAASYAGVDQIELAKFAAVNNAAMMARRSAMEKDIEAELARLPAMRKGQTVNLGPRLIQMIQDYQRNGGTDKDVSRIMTMVSNRKQAQGA